MINEHRPIPYALSQWDSRTEIFYKCPKCGQSFKLNGQHEKFCHNCGLEIDWQDMPSHCSLGQRALADSIQKNYEDFHHDYTKFQEEMIKLYFEIYQTPEKAKNQSKRK